MPEPVVPVGFSGRKGKLQGRAWVLHWHCSEHTPLDTFTSGAGDSAFLVGEAIPEESNGRLSAKELFGIFDGAESAESSRLLSRYSGLFAWVLIRADGSVEAGSDPFGAFPVYYFHTNKAFGLSTSLAAFRRHPDYDFSIDPVGFSRILMENGGSGSHTLEKGARRLNIAESLRWNPSEGRLQTYQNRHPGYDAEKSDLSRDDATELAVELTRAAVKRHMPDSCDSVLLSGGLDSRHVSAIAAEMGHRPRGMTIGKSDSIESRCAKEAAKLLGLSWECSGGFAEDPGDVLQSELRLFSLGAGFNGMSLWTCDSSWSRGAHCLNGVYLDLVYSPYSAYKMNAHVPGTFESVRDGWANHFGVRFDTLPSLYSDSTFKSSVDEAVHGIRRDWESMTGDPVERIWQSIVRYRGRAHLGGFLWKNAFRAWPITPALDVPLIEGIRKMPSEYFKDRWLQKANFLKLRPDLASIPFAISGSGPRPIVKNMRTRYLKRKWKVQKHLSARWDSGADHPNSQIDSRKACWSQAEELAMRRPNQWSSIFEPDAVERYMNAVPVHEIAEVNGEYSAGRRMLLGGLCWLSMRDSSLAF